MRFLQISMRGSRTGATSILSAWFESWIGSAKRRGWPMSRTHYATLRQPRRRPRCLGADDRRVARPLCPRRHPALYPHRRGAQNDRRPCGRRDGRPAGRPGGPGASASRPRGQFKASPLKWPVEDAPTACGPCGTDAPTGEHIGWIVRRDRCCRCRQRS